MEIYEMPLTLVLRIDRSAITLVDKYEYELVRGISVAIMEAALEQGISVVADKISINNGDEWRLNMPRYDYARVKPCGCVTAIMDDTPDDYTAKEIARWIKAGYIVEHLEVSIACQRHLDFVENGCNHNDIDK